MRRLVTLSVPVCLLSFSCGAIAASEPQVTMPTNSWDGFYIGVKLGEAIGDSHKLYVNDYSTGDFIVEGVIGGLDLGYNKRARSEVIGIETEVFLTGVSGQGNCGNTRFNCGTANHWQATLGPHIGYVFGSLMPYLTAGLAIGDVEVKSGLKTNGGGGVDYSKTQVGWTAGLGIEKSVNSNWSVEAEYLYVNWNDTNAPSNNGQPTSTIFFEDEFLVGLTYAFN